jgi:hypothetical protein
MKIKEATTYSTIVVTLASVILAKTLPTSNNPCLKYSEHCQPGCRGGASYCEDSECYPDQAILCLLEKTNIPKGTFTGRNKRSVEDVSSSFSQVITPKVARNKNGEFMFIAMPQEVVISVCSQVQVLSDCKQMYMERMLTAVAADGTVSIDTFIFPSKCSCSIQD